MFKGHDDNIHNKFNVYRLPTTVTAMPTPISILRRRISQALHGWYLSLFFLKTSKYSKYLNVKSFFLLKCSEHLNILKKKKNCEHCGEQILTCIIAVVSLLKVILTQKHAGDLRRRDTQPGRRLGDRGGFCRWCYKPFLHFLIFSSFLHLF